MIHNYAILIVTAAVVVWYYYKLYVVDKDGKKSLVRARKHRNPESAARRDPILKTYPKQDGTRSRKPKPTKKEPHWMDPQLMGSQTTQYSRNRGYGDPIRGDLPIVPDDGGWFATRANPAHHLHTGALSMIGGDASDCGSTAVQQLIKKYEDKGCNNNGLNVMSSHYGGVM
ncbi:hypothetical protein [Singapore grouper iridovirus]|nr:hypothetical protein [Singapore grouper iridovirus]